MCLRLYNDLKFAVQNCSYVCTNLILDHMISPGKEAFELRSLQLSGFLSAHPSNYQLIHPPTNPSVIRSFLHPPTLYRSICHLSIHSSIHPSLDLYLATHPLIPLTYPPTYLTTHQSICHPSFPSSIHPSVCPSACPFIYPLSYLLTWGISLTDNLAKHLSSPRRHCQCMSY